MRHIPPILQLDVSGTPNKWIDFEQAVFYITKGMVAWTYGAGSVKIWGGEDRLTKTRSFLDVDLVMAIKGHVKDIHLHRPPHVTSKLLFRRDNMRCAYCGEYFHSDELTRDHILPTSKGGRTSWENMVTACGPCNRRKGDRTPEQAQMPMLYNPYKPTKSEAMLLMHRQATDDQVGFLLSRIPETSRIFDVERYQQLVV